MEQSKNTEFRVSKFSAWYILIICTLLYIINYADRQVFTICTEFIKKDLNLSDTQIGIIQTLFFASIAVFSFPAAYLVDRWSRRKTISIMAICWSALTFATGLANNFVGILTPRSLVGVGEAGFTSAGTPLIAAAFPKKLRGMAMGVFNSAIIIGSAAGVIMGGFIAQNYGWRMVFFIFGIPGIILGICALFMKDYKTVRGVNETGQKISFFNSAVSLFSIPTLKWLYIGFAMQMIMAVAAMTWLPAFVMRSQGLDGKQAGMLVGGLSLLGIFGALFGGIISDMWQKKNDRGRMLTAATSMLLMAIFYALALYYDIRGPLGLTFAVIYSVLSLVGMPCLSAASQDVSPPSLKGVSWGMATFFCYTFGGAWAPLVVGAISDGLGGGAYGIKIGLLASAIPGLVAALFYWLSSRHYAADMKKVEKYIVEAV